MRCAVLMLILLHVSACKAPADNTMPPETGASTPRIAAEIADDGTYLQRIDPLGGQWQVQQLGQADYRRFNAWIGFSDGGFLNHGAGCGGGYPAFYRLEGEEISVTRIEPIRTGKCSGTAELAGGSAAAREVAAESERRLGAFIDQLSRWERQGNTLLLVARDGTRASLSRPQEPHPELAGRWLIESIGGEPLVTERRPATLSIGLNSIGVHADCNSMGGSFTTPAPGRISVAAPIVGTAIGCAPEDQAEDDLMSRAMTLATAYRLEGDRLIFSGGPGMIARRPPPPDRRLAGEYQACGNTLLGAYHEGPITLAIGTDTIRDNAGCIARYSADGPNLSLELGQNCAASAPAFVPGEPIGVGGRISTLAVTRPDGFGFNEQGQLVLRTNRGLLTMCRAGSPPPFGS
jgi:heat shock protein HslJ